MAIQRSFSRRGGWSTHQTTYRSGLEDKISAQISKVTGGKISYEDKVIKYTVPLSNHTYTPDFVLPNGIIIEAKGLFVTEDRKKHLLIQKQYPNLDIRFVFSNPHNKLYKGSKTTYGDWCTKNDILYAKSYIPLEWFKESRKDTKGLQDKKKRERKVGK